MLMAIGCVATKSGAEMIQMGAMMQSAMMSASDRAANVRA